MGMPKKAIRDTEYGFFVTGTGYASWVVTGYGL